jgi:transcription antitermination factor NusG
VRVIDGLLAKIVCIILELKHEKQHLIVSVELFQRSVAVVLNNEAVEPFS